MNFRSISRLLNNIEITELNQKITFRGLKLTNNQLKEYISKHLFERRLYYNKCKIIIDCDEIREDDIVEKILLSLN